MPDSVSTGSDQKETPFEAVASICHVLVIGLFILILLAWNFVIPSGSMENTLWVGDHLLVDRITLGPPCDWMPLVHYREPRRGDVTVFIKPVADDVNGALQYQFLVERLIGVPGDRLHLHNGIVVIDDVAQARPYAQPTTLKTTRIFLTSFLRCRLTQNQAITLPNHGQSTSTTTSRTAIWSFLGTSSLSGATIDTIVPTPAFGGLCPGKYRR